MRRRLAVVTPYNPLEIHDHAAEQLTVAAVRELARYYDVTVIAPAASVGRERSIELPTGISVFPLQRTRSDFRRFLGLYPAGARKDWTKRMSKSAVRALKTIKPDRLHIEYLQPLEVGFESSMPFTATFHDVGSEVYRQRVETARGLIEASYRYVEWLRVCRVERKALEKAAGVVCLSQKDAKRLRSATRRRVVSVSIGFNKPAFDWHSAPTERPSLVFAGALWRDANSAAAAWLIEQVCPRLASSYPTALLKIVGRGAPAWLTEMARNAPNAVLIGSVPSIEEEYASAQLVVAPTLLDAGVLIKAVTALAVGAPVLLNTAAADPLGVTDGVDAFVADGAADFAASVTRALSDWGRTVEVARAGRAHVEQSFSWAAYGAAMRDIIG